MFKQLGFLGTGATLGADITLVAQIVFFVVLVVGVVAQLQQRHRAHDMLQAPVVLLNLVFIIFLMAVSLREQQLLQTLPRRPGDPYYLAGSVHAVLGTVTEGLAIYCLLAGFKILPRKIGRLRYFMRATFGLWTLTFLFGLATYYFWYVRSADAAAVAEVSDLAATTQAVTLDGPPPPRRVSLQSFLFEPADLTVVRGTKVIWINQDNAPHNVTFSEGSLASDNYFQGEAFEHTFRALGTFQVYCTLHGNATSGMASTVSVVEASQENVTALGGAPEMNTQPQAPTPVPPVPPAPVSLITPPEPDDVVAGILAFRDHLGPSDSLIMTLVDVALPPEGQELHAWLTSGDGRVWDLGRLEPNPSGNVAFTYQDPQRQNLMAQAAGVLVTLEPTAGDPPIPGEVIYSGLQPLEAYNIIRELTVAAETPQGAGYAVAARRQAEELIRHAEYVRLANKLGSIADAQRHAEHIVNILAGEGREPFGDLDGEHGVQNPGDGFGLIPYVNTMKDVALRAGNSADATHAMLYHAEHVEIAANAALNSAALVSDAAQAILAADSAAQIGDPVSTLKAASRRLLLGEDTDGDGNVSLEEGGIFIAYQHAQYMGAIGIIAGADFEVVDPRLVAEPDLEAQLAGGEVVIDMLDYIYSLPSLTIPTGTSVRFKNVGRDPHSATADDGRWDTTLLESGGESVIAFDQPGFNPYYCLLHGTAGGQGMAGSITVVEAGAGAVEESLPTPTPEAQGAPDAAEFSLEMIDFSYSVLDFTVPAGTKITFFNTGEAEHSATADDGSWDTTLLKNGEQVTLTFETPGAYTYYCILHGVPGLQGMAGTLRVVEPEARGGERPLALRAPP
ncbi:MAG: plastocyanin/azurin family copper-binding protein [Candidatus Promineifilaceae bacterium]